VRIQLFNNGEPVKPKAAPNGFVDGNDAWILDINPAGLANTLPVTIGRSEAPAVEYLNGVVDEFSLFPTALNHEQVRQLFLEVAGANVRELIAQDVPAAPKVPVISGLSQPGVQIGQATSVTFSGSDLGQDSQVILPIPNIAVQIAASQSNQLMVQIHPAAEAVPGIYPVWIANPQGVSRPATLVIDRLRQLPMPTAGPEAPSELPAAFFGTLAGSAQPKVYFAAKKGQRFVADV
jgi:hypothetical protein